MMQVIKYVASGTHHNVAAGSVQQSRNQSWCMKCPREACYFLRTVLTEEVRASQQLHLGIADQEKDVRIFGVI